MILQKIMELADFVAQAAPCRSRSAKDRQDKCENPGCCRTIPKGLFCFHRLISFRSLDVGARILFKPPGLRPDGPKNTRRYYRLSDEQMCAVRQAGIKELWI